MLQVQNPQIYGKYIYSSYPLPMEIKKNKDIEFRYGPS